MKDFWVSSIYILAGLIKPSIPSGFYLCFVLVQFILLKLQGRVYPAAYKVFLFLGLMLVLLKAGLYTWVMFSISELSFASMEEWLRLLGYFNSFAHEFGFNDIYSVVPEILGVVASIIGLISARNFSEREIKKSMTGGTISRVVCFFLCIGACVSHISIFNSVYAFICLYWGISWSYKETPLSGKYGAIVLVVTSFVQCLWSYAFWIGLTGSVNDPYRYGVITVSEALLIPHFVCVIGVYTFATNVAKQNIYQGMGRMTERLIHLVLPRTNTSMSFAKALYLDIVYILSKILMFFVIFQYSNFASFALLLYLLLSSFLSYSSYVSISKIVAIPVLVLNFCSFYIIEFLQVDTMKYEGLFRFRYPSMNFGLIFAAICLHLYLIKEYNGGSPVKRSESQLALFLILISQNLIRFSIALIFLVGLSAINLFNTVFIVASLVFMLNFWIAEKCWKLLIGYTMALVSLSYFWMLLTQYIDFSEYSSICNFMGLPQDMELIWEIFPKNILVWILLGTELLQNREFQSRLLNIDYSMNVEDTLKKNWFFLRYTLKCIQMPSNTGIWFGYITIFLIIYLSPLNILNMLRLLVITLALYRHLSSFSKDTTKCFWLVLEVYSGFLLVVRYIYQYIFYVPGLEQREFPIIGVGVYSLADIYIYMVPDCAILLISVVIRRGYFGASTERVKFVSLDIYSLLEEYEKSKNKSEWVIMNTIFSYFSMHFNHIMILTVILLSMLWKFSLTMFFLLFPTSVFILKNINYFYILESCELHRFREIEIEFRLSTWKPLFTLTLLCNLFSYTVFLVKEEILGANIYGKALWVYNFMGVTISDTSILLNVNYGFFLLGILTVIERLSISKLSSTTKFKKMNDSLRMMLKLLVETVIPVMILFISFYTISIVGNFYVLAIFVTLFINSSLTRIKFLSYCLVIISEIAYLLYLSNVNNEIIPGIEEMDNLVPIPWYSKIDLLDSLLVYLSVEPSVRGTYSLLYQQLVLYLCFFHLQYLARSSTSLTVKDDTKIGKVFKFIRHAFYEMSPIILLVIVLVFVSQNYGLISMIYCMLSLTIIFKSHNLYSMKHFSTFFTLTINKYFLKFLCFDLLLQMSFQLLITYGSFEDETFWTNVIGVFSLIQPQNSSERREMRLRILLKILVFAGLYLIIRLLDTNDFQKYREIQRQRSMTRPIDIGLRMAQNFNDKRLDAEKAFNEEEHRFENELKKLDKNTENWNKRFYDHENIRRTTYINPHNYHLHRASTTIVPQKTLIQEDPGEPLKVKLQNFFLWLINPVLMEKYIDKMTMQEMVSMSDPEREELENSIDLSKEGEDFAVNLEHKESKNVVDLEWTDYFVFAYYVLISNTQALVFLSFFLNHFMYCSLVSLVLPISVLVYACLDYPRPSYKYYRAMLAYLAMVFFVKFTIELDIWRSLFGYDVLSDYKDPWKIGIAKSSNTYSKSLLYYTLWDAICILFILFHEYYLEKVGLVPEAEYDLETLEEARKRRLGEEYEAPRIRKKSYCQRVKEYFIRLIPTKIEEKPGTDLYVWIVLVQLIILIYIFCCYSRMEGMYQNISESFKANQFDGRMVIAFCIQILLILFDRYLYLSYKSQKNDELPEYIEPYQTSEIIHIKKWPQILRVLIHILLVIFVHFLVFWYFPLEGNLSLIGQIDCVDLYNDLRCNNFQVNSHLQIFYLIYMAYFVLMALQIKFGVPISRTGQFPLQRNTSRLSKYVFHCYRLTPFLFELRTIMDWTFTKTALDLFQWFKFEDITAELYLTKCRMLIYQQREKGSPMGAWFKVFVGFLSLVFIIFFIVMPLILFSSINPITQANPVQSLDTNIGFKLKNNYYNIYQVSRATNIHLISDEEWEQLNLNSLPEIKAEDKEMLQVVNLPSSSDKLWDITPASKELLCSCFLNKHDDLNFELSYKFLRAYPYEQPEITGTVSQNLTLATRETLNEMICLGNRTQVSIEIGEALIFRIPSAGTQINPISIFNLDLNPTLELSIKQSDVGIKYWEIDSQDGKRVKLYAISEYYSLVTFNFSVITFYVSVVYFIGRIIRSIIGGGSRKLNITDCPNPQKLIDMCNAVYIYRSKGDLAKEDEYYFELIDLLRSTEMTKWITGSSSKKEKID